MFKTKLWACLSAFIGSAFGLAAQQSEVVYDYVIVGNGTAGAVLARKLSDSGKKKVLVLEAGVNHDNDPEVLDSAGDFPWLLGLTDMTNNPKYAQTYGMSVFGLPFASGVYSEGRGWGGGSMHNYQQVYRGTPGIYDSWAAISGNPMWSYNNVLPTMKAFENFTPSTGTNFNPSQRGVGGPISITEFPALDTGSPFNIAFATAMVSGFVNDTNDPTEISTTPVSGGVAYLGFAPYQMFATPGPTNGTTGVRSFSSRDFLDPVVTPDGRARGKRLLRIESNAQVARVLFNGKTAIGVEFVDANAPNQILQAFGKQIILCAGAINSPAILQRSGIGDPAVLEPLGIKVLVANPNVGANLVNQYGVVTLMTGNSSAAPFLQGMTNGASLSGPYPTIFASHPTDAIRRLQAIVAGAGPGLSQVIWFFLQPKSLGNVQIVSTNPLTQPLINLNMYSDGSFTQNYNTFTDEDLALTAFQLSADVAAAAGQVVLVPSAATYAQGNAALLQYAKSLSGSVIASHAAGTCRMAQTMGEGVVDGNLNVFGVKNLMVADLGIAPVIPDGNTCYSVYTIALTAAKILGVPTPPAL